MICRPSLHVGSSNVHTTHPWSQPLQRLKLFTATSTSYQHWSCNRTPWQTCSRMWAFSLWASVSCLESSSLCWRSCRRIASISATRCSNTAMPLFSSGVNRRLRLKVEITYLLCDSWKQHRYWRHVSHPPSHRPLNCFSCAAMCRLSSDFSSSALRRSFCTLHTHRDGRP